MDKKKRTTTLIIAGIICVVLIIGIILTNSGEPKPETVKEVMRDAVVHDSNKVNFFGMEVNPSVISAFTVTGLILLFALIVRILVIPKFKKIPGKFQMALEAWVGFFDNLAKTNSPHLNKFLGAYVFAAGSYICIGTLFELFGLQVVTTERHSVALPAPIADINAAVQMGVTSYLIIL